MKRKLILFWLLLLLSWPARPAWACEPHPDLWFAEVISLDLAGLPPAFQLYKNQFGAVDGLPAGIWLFSHTADERVRSAIYIINRTPDPLYILSLQHRERLVMETPDPNYAARINMAHEAASYLLRPDLGETLALDLKALRDLDNSLVNQNTSSYNPPPANTPLPEPQYSELLLVWGEQVVVVPFTITYQINANYNNGGCDAWWAAQSATETARQAAKQAQTTRQVGLVVGVLVVGVLLSIAIWRRFKTH